jgi:NTP pyrophosphatase (non-canonical NTP hydrolase)
MNELQILMNDISEWSDSTFGDVQRNPAIVYHLKKEVDELIESLHKSNSLRLDNSIGVDEFNRQTDKVEMEFADCFMLLLDSARHFGLTAEQLIELTKEKLSINKARKWGKPDANGVVEHINETDS